MLDFRLYLLQRATALIMAPLALLRLAVMVYAIQGGLDAGKILGRTRGSLFWGLVYGLFVVCVSIHGAIGLRVVLYETLGLKPGLLNVFTWLITGSLLLLGGRAVYGVVWA